MYIEANTLDDLLKVCFERIIELSPPTINSTKGKNKEIAGAYLKLNNPQARLSIAYSKARIFSCLGEFLWYLNGDDKLSFIEYYIKKYKSYSDDGQTLNGAYGRRWFSMNNRINQIELIKRKLSTKSDTRKAVIQILDVEDLEKDSKDIPCTTFLQFLVRDNKLDLFGFMRSNDLFKGFPHDVFCFTMLQEIIARELNFELGSYHHFVTSLHIYDEDLEKVKAYIAEGLQSTKYYMPPMPSENLTESLELLKNFERKIRLNEEYDIESLKIENYWKDLIYILKAYNSFKRKDEDSLKDLKDILGKINYAQFYSIFINDKLNSLKEKNE